MKEEYHGPERREFLRLEYVTPLACKVCKPETISQILQGYTSNISQAGLLCHINEKVNKNDILWLAFDRATLKICRELEKHCFIYQAGVIGKVVRVETKEDSTCDVGIQFITRKEEKESEPYISKLLLMKIPDKQTGN
jgi:hypothetical protein